MALIDMEPEASVYVSRRIVYILIVSANKSMSIEEKFEKEKRHSC